MIISENNFISSDNTNVFYYECLPNDGNVSFIIQFAHGMAEHSGRYMKVAKFLTSNGGAVYILDHRGHGKSINNYYNYGVWPDKNTWFKIVDDIKNINKIAKNKYLGVPNFIFGHSMGSFLTRSLIVEYSSDIDGIIISGTGTYSNIILKIGRLIAKIDIKLKGYAHKSKLIDKMAFGGFNKGYTKPYQWLTRDLNVVDEYIRDPYCGGLMSSSFYYSFFSGILFLNKFENLNKIRKSLPVFFISGTNDPVGKNSKGVNEAVRIYKKVGIKNVDCKLYEGGRHEMLNEVNSEEVFYDIYKWLIKTIAENGK